MLINVFDGSFPPMPRPINMLVLSLFMTFCSEGEGVQQKAMINCFFRTKTNLRF